MHDKIPNVVLVGAGGVVGAIIRYLISIILQHTEFPFATLIVNIIGSILLGLLMGLVESQNIETGWVLLLGVGFMGSLTTMSTFAVETINSGSFILAITNIVITLIGVLVGAFVGRGIGYYIGN